MRGPCWALDDDSAAESEETSEGYDSDAADGYSWLHLPEPRLPRHDGVTRGEIEAAVLASPELASVDLLRLYEPRPFAYCFVSAPLRLAIESAGVTGVTFSDKKTVTFTAEPGTAAGPPIAFLALVTPGAGHNAAR